MFLPEVGGVPELNFHRLLDIEELQVFIEWPIKYHCSIHPIA